MRYLIILFILFLVESTAFGYSSQQVNNLYFAKSIADTYLCYDHNGKQECYDQTFMAMMCQESSCGVHKVGDDGKSIGLVHVTYAAARDVIRACGTDKYFHLCGWFASSSMDKTTINVQLQTNDYYNLLVAAMYFRMQFDYYREHQYSQPWARALMDYNCGPGCSKSRTQAQIQYGKYVSYIRHRISNLRKYNRRHHIWKWS